MAETRSRVRTWAVVAVAVVAGCAVYVGSDEEPPAAAVWVALASRNGEPSSLAVLRVEREGSGRVSGRWSARDEAGTAVVHDGTRPVDSVRRLLRLGVPPRKQAYLPARRRWIDEDGVHWDLFRREDRLRW